MTISELVVRMLDEERLNYDGIRIPRLPIKLHKVIQEKMSIKINNDNLN